MSTARSWSVQDAKARFSELLETVIEQGPQVVSRRGVELAVVVPLAEWRRLQEGSRPSLKDLLLGDGPRFELPIPERGGRKRRRPEPLV
ncbi:MAG: type II toxin-antitoxin system Phd/YefM family antitoxin [Thermoanaerobaculia bacterium]|nr:type II toxin-antitoxin system Phd/YefM family antitoxin [Thermoanaerobaculia bacterium]